MATTITAYEGDDSVRVKEVDDRENKSPSTRFAKPAETTSDKEAVAAIMEDDDPVSIKRVEDPDNKSQSMPQG